MKNERKKKTKKNKKEANKGGNSSDSIYANFMKNLPIVAPSQQYHHIMIEITLFCKLIILWAYNYNDITRYRGCYFFRWPLLPHSASISINNCICDFLESCFGCHVTSTLSQTVPMRIIYKISFRVVNRPNPSQNSANLLQNPGSLSFETVLLRQHEFAICREVKLDASSRQPTMGLRKPSPMICSLQVVA